MITKSLRFCGFILVLFSVSFHLLGQHLPEKPNPPRFVNDLAGIFSENAVSALENKLHRYRDTTSTQIVVLTIGSLGGYDIEGYANEVARNWGIGEKGKDNGILILVAKEERKVRIEVGYGLEGTVPDVASKEIIRELIKPNFKNGDYYQGIDQAVDRIIALASGQYKASPGKKQGGGTVLIFVLIVVLILVFSFISKYRQVKRSHIGHGLDFWTILTLINAMGDSRRNRGGGGPWGGGGSSSGGGGWDFGGGDFGGGGASGDW